MAENDFALLVGITRYPKISPLQGPEKDADMFYQWLRGKGQVPEDRIIRVLSSAFQGAQPSMEDVEDAFENLRIAVEKALETNGRQRRLYLFLAGHGLSWDADSAALLTANADYFRRRVCHVAGFFFAEWFRNAAYFEEIVLLMDCCRTEFPNTPLRRIWEAKNNPYKVNVRRFYAFATKGGAAARERIIPPGTTPQGLFTYALLEGLDKAVPDDQGRITGLALRTFLRNRLPQLGDPRLPQEPHVEVLPPDPDTIIWALQAPTPLPPRNKVSIAIALPRPWPVEVFGPKLNKVGSFTQTPFEMTDLPGGIYTLRWPADKKEIGFEVVGTARAIAIVVDRDPATQTETVTYANA